MNDTILPEHKAIRHNQFNDYVFREVIPFIKNLYPSVLSTVLDSAFKLLHESPFVLSAVLNSSIFFQY